MIKPRDVYSAQYFLWGGGEMKSTGNFESIIGCRASRKLYEDKVKGPRVCVTLYNKREGGGIPKVPVKDQKNFSFFFLF